MYAKNAYKPKVFKELTDLQDLVSRLTADNPTINNGVLQVAHSIFKRWRPLYRSDALFTEINHVLSKFGPPFLSLVEVGFVLTRSAYIRRY